MWKDKRGKSSVGGGATQYELNTAARNSPVQPSKDAATTCLPRAGMSLLMLSTTSQERGETTEAGRPDLVETVT